MASPSLRGLENMKKIILLSSKDNLDSNEIIKKIESLILENNGEVYEYLNEQEDEISFDAEQFHSLGYLVCIIK